MRTVSIDRDRGWPSLRTHDAEPAYTHAWCIGHVVAGGIVGNMTRERSRLVPPIRIERTKKELENEVLR
jgi:hypothetical protein